MKKIIFLLALTLNIQTTLVAQNKRAQLDEALVGEWKFLFQKDPTGVIKPTSSILKGAKKYFYANGIVKIYSPHSDQMMTKLNIKDHNNPPATWTSNNGRLIITQRSQGTESRESSYGYYFSGDTLVTVDFRNEQTFWLKRIPQKKK
jgi:hypothetical protein